MWMGLKILMNRVRLLARYTALSINTCVITVAHINACYIIVDQISLDLL